MKISFLRIFAVWRRFRRGALRHHIHHERYLPQIESLMRRADPRASWQIRANWMVDVADWIRREPKVSLLDQAEWRRVKQQRIRYMLSWLDDHRDVRQSVQQTLQKTLREATGHELFSSTGLPRESAFFSELSERLVRQFLPSPVTDCDLSTLFTTMFPDPSDAELLLELDHRTLSRLWKLCADDGIAHGYRQQIDEAMLYLVTMVISVGVSPAFRQRLEPRMPLLATPFMALRRELENFLMTRGQDLGALRSVRMLIAVCQAQTDRIYSHLDRHGVSVGLVYHIERMRAQLIRIGRLLDLRNAPRSDAGASQVQAVLVDLIAAHHQRSSVRELVRRSFALMARKMVERNADHGEPYIARDAREYRLVLKAALIGGAVTSFAALGKVAITHLGLAYFFEGMFVSIMFAGTFLLLTAFGGVLAARQPAVTAPALAAEMGELDTAGGMRNLLTRITALLRAQSASIFGNVFAVIPTVTLLALAWLHLAGKPMMSIEKAHVTLQSMSLLGATPLFAAFTGLLIWLASLSAGFADNWFALRRLKEAIAHHRRLNHALGQHRSERWADWLENNIAAIAGNVSLAVLLGMSPAIAHFFGVPLDVRHVALSTATLSAAVVTLGWQALATPQFWLAAAGVVAVGALNVAVAFFCTLALALRARDIPRIGRRAVVRSMTLLFARSPYQFLWPTGRTRLPVHQAVQDAHQDMQREDAENAAQDDDESDHQPPRRKQG